jgi:two-component system cell cycle response regulator DivK
LRELDTQHSLVTQLVQSLSELENYRSSLKRLSYSLSELDEHRALVAQLAQSLGKSGDHAPEAKHLSQSLRDLDAYSLLAARLSGSSSDLEKQAAMVEELAQALTSLDAHRSLVELLPKALSEPEIEEIPAAPDILEPEPVPVAPPVNEPSPKILSNIVLAIEDNLTNMILISRVVEAEGYELIQADDGNAALEILSTVIPDLILLDINIPGIHGLDLARRLKADPEMNHVPLIATTANVLLGDKERCLEAGCNEYLPKPLDIRELRQVMRTYLRPEAH